MPKLNDMFPTKWLGAKDLLDLDGNPSEMVVTIDSIVEESIGKNNDRKWVVYFLEMKKGLVLNKTNTTTIANLHGQDTDEWEGKKITLYATEVQFQGDMVEAIRVRSKAPKDKKSAKQSPAVKMVDDDEHDADVAPF